jgi:mutator protein MutT
MEQNKKTPLHHSGTPTSPAIDVAAALIFRDGKLLITQRYADAPLGRLWEFPGGKREAPETFEQCLVREIREELGVEVSVGELFEEVIHTYPGEIVHLKFFFCRLEGDELQARGCAAFRWVSAAELDKHQFPPADRKLLEKLRAAAEFKL